MFIRSDATRSTHDHRHNDHSTAATMVTKVNRDSHLIKKSSPITTSPPNKTKTQHPRQPQPPLIIYAHAPRVIHTKPQEFKALVQTLTGYTGKKNPTNKIDSPQVQSHTPPPSKVPPMYYNFEQFETKNNIYDVQKQNASMQFTAPIFDPALMQANNSLQFLGGDPFCWTSNDLNCGNGYNDKSVGKVNEEEYVGVEIGNGSGSGCYYSDGLSSSLDLSSSLSSVEEAIDELTEFS